MGGRLSAISKTLGPKARGSNSHTSCHTHQVRECVCFSGCSADAKLIKLWLFLFTVAYLIMLFCNLCTKCLVGMPFYVLGTFEFKCKWRWDHFVWVYLLLDCGVFLLHVPFLFGSINHQLVQLQETEQLIHQAYQTSWSHVLNSQQHTRMFKRHFSEFFLLRNYISCIG